MAAIAATGGGGEGKDDLPPLPTYQCQQPVQLLGVQPETPLCWSACGTRPVVILQRTFLD